MHPAPNAVWQIDGTTIALVDATSATVVQIIDEDSRLDIAATPRAARTATRSGRR